MKNKKRYLLLFLLNTFTLLAFSQTYNINGIIRLNDTISSGATVKLLPGNLKTISNSKGFYEFQNLQPGNFEVIISYLGAKTVKRQVRILNSDLRLNINLETAAVNQLDEVNVKDRFETQASGNLKQVEGTAIYAGKKTEVVNLANLNVNLATNNTRQIYSRVAGINIIEYDGGGLQLGIGGRGLNPSRVSNFNTRQHGYDISADALGYPESYYTPSAEALERIEIIRGAASLQYGTQFGGLINFQLKKGPADKPFEITSRQTAGSFGFFNTFNSIGGTVKKLNYYAYYQYKRGDGWRPNSHFDQHGAYAHLDYLLTNKLKITGEYTFMDYLAQLPGGLTDADFAADARQSVRSRNWFKVNWNLA
jgi:Fe(3+) dicitrate transport protein